MKRLLLFAVCSFAALFTACGSDSTPSHSNYILDTETQTIGFIYGLCHYTATSVSWKDYVDTVFFHYSWLGDSLLLQKKKSTEDLSADYSSSGYIVLTGGTAGKLQGTWTDVGYCDADQDGKPRCEEKDEDEEDAENAKDVTMSLVISSNDVYWSMKANSCAMKSIKYYLEGLEGDFDIDAFSKKDCNSGTVKVNGITATIAVTDFSVKDNMFYKKYTISTALTTCTYDEESSSDGAGEEYMQMSSSWCNVTDMAQYMSNKDSADDASFISHYRKRNSDEFKECLSSLFGVLIIKSFYSETVK